MSTETRGWYPDPILRALLAWTGVAGLLFWLPLVGSLLRGSAEAGMWGPGVAGGAAGLWIPLVAVSVAGATLWTGWRGARRPFGGLLLAFHVPMAALVVWTMAIHPEAGAFGGAVSGTDATLGWIASAAYVAFAGLAVWWVFFGDADPAGRAPAWSPESRAFLTAAAVLIPIQWLLLHTTGATDPAAVVVTIGQWVLLNMGLRPARRLPARVRARAATRVITIV